MCEQWAKEPRVWSLVLTNAEVFITQLCISHRFYRVLCDLHHSLLVLFLNSYQCCFQPQIFPLNIPWWLNHLLSFCITNRTHVYFFMCKSVLRLQLTIPTKVFTRNLCVCVCVCVCVDQVTQSVSANLNCCFSEAGRQTNNLFHYCHYFYWHVNRELTEWTCKMIHSHIMSWPHNCLHCLRFLAEWELMHACRGRGIAVRLGSAGSAHATHPEVVYR